MREANEFLATGEDDVPEVEQCLRDLKRAMENAGIVPDDTGEASTPLPGGGALVAVADMCAKGIPYIGYNTENK